MKYIPVQETIPQSKRQEFNEKIVYLIDSDTAVGAGITKEDIYNAYTGDGGLHGLERSMFDSYAKYSEAKKEVENGQFFTPPYLCKFITDCLQVDKEDVVADLTFGMGSFFNFMPSEANLYGCEIDTKAYKVAHYLYPAANLENKDIRLYQPPMRFDIVVGNPPFNLRWWIEDKKEMPSHLYYCQKAAELLKPLGILALIVPMSFLADDFTDSGAIAEMERQFSFLGQLALPEDAFSEIGVAAFPIKLQFWQKIAEIKGWTPNRYYAEVTPVQPSDCYNEQFAKQIYVNMLLEARGLLQGNRSRILLELAKGRNISEDFQFQAQKLLYQIKCHPRLQEKYARCCEHLHQLYTQQKPDSMEYEEWCRVRLTEAKVLSYLKKVVSNQHPRPVRDEIKLVKRDYDFVYKGYSPLVRRQMSKAMKTPIPTYAAASTDGLAAFPGYERLMRRKQLEYIIQNQQFSDMAEDAGIAAWLADFRLWDDENEEEIRPNEIQRHDLNLTIQKRYTLLQWEQGTGKTLAGIAVGLYRMQRREVYHTWVVSTAISIRNNWDLVLPNYGLSYVLVERLSDLERIQPGDFVLITLNKLGEYRRQIKRWVRMHNRKVQLVFDESDEMSNPASIRTKAVLACFRRCRYKLLETGTSTRNNIVEFAPQAELLYNNSVNMLSWCKTLYRRDRKTGDLSEEYNPFYGTPIPAYRNGYNLFSASHLPEKITVFGVGQRTQDIYNADELDEFLGKTVITRTFEEVTGKEIRRIHQVPVQFSDPERAVYQQAIDEFYKLRWNYFSTTNNYRKDAMMRLIQQIVLLLRISAAPNTMDEYTGGLPVKLQKVVDMINQWPDEIVAVGVRHKIVVDAYAQAIQEHCPDRPIFIVTGTTMSLAKRRKLRHTLRESGNGILICTQQSLPSSVNFEYVNKIIIPELHYNNSRMSQFYMRFIRYTSTEWKDIYFVTYAGSIESNQMQMVLAKEKINLFMKGQDVDLDEIYEKFGVDYDLLALLMYQEEDEEGHFKIRWGEQKIS